MAQAAAPAPSGHAAPAAVEEAPKAVPPSEWVTSYGAEMAKHMFTDNKRLISTVCRRRLLDYEFAFSDKIDPNSTMRKLCTEKEVKDVRQPLHTYIHTMNLSLLLTLWLWLHCTPCSGC